MSPNDEILVTVYQEDDLTTKTIIDKNGMVMLPLLGQVKISGLTVGQATAQIQQLYDKDYLVNPTSQFNCGTVSPNAGLPCWARCRSRAILISRQMNR